jgi:hypothetical protein
MCVAFSGTVDDGGYLDGQFDGEYFERKNIPWILLHCFVWVCLVCLKCGGVSDEYRVKLLSGVDLLNEKRDREMFSEYLCMIGESTGTVIEHVFVYMDV